ncbi:MAG: carbohydrate-binding domain-containing protein [Prevotella sp.]|nr:carbohydrate-binding domain-containing protein [Prevotella sp.]
MKRIITLLLLCACTFAAFPRYIGDINNDGSITIADVTALVNIILGKTTDYETDVADVNQDGSVTIADVTQLVNIILGKEDPTELAEVDTLFIYYTDDAVTYNMPSSWSDYVTVTIDGTDVTVDNTNEAEEYVTALSGSCSNGSFTYNGTYKTSIVLKGLSLTNDDSAAMAIVDGKRVSLQLPDGYENTLIDGEVNAYKAALYCKGHLEISGGGTLNVQGNLKHGISTKEYLEIKKTVGAINITGAVGDGIHAEQYYEQKGGTITMTNVMGDGVQAEAKQEGDDLDGQIIISGGTLNITLTESDVAGLKSDSLMTISGGTISVTSTGDDVKALKSNDDILVTDGTINVTQSGSYLVTTTTDTDGNTVYDPSYSTAFKSDSLININGGEITINSTADGGRGLNADMGINVTDGTLTVNAYGGGGVLDLSSSSSSTTSSSYVLYVSVPTGTSGGSGGGPGGQHQQEQQSAWSNVYLYDSSGNYIATLTEQKSFTVNETTTNFYYYDFGEATSGTYYLKSDNYSQGGGGGGSTSYTIQTSSFSLNLTGSDAFYSISSSYSTSGSTRTYTINNVTSTYANASTATEEGETYKAFGLKSDGTIAISGGTITIEHTGTMSKGIKAETVEVSGGTINDTADGMYMIVGTDPTYSAAIKCTTYIGSSGEVTIQGTGSASRGISTDGTLTISGGTYDLTMSGDGATYTGNGETEGVGARGFKSDGDMTLKGGTITINSSARGGKGIKVGTSDATGTSGAKLIIGDSSTTDAGPTLTVSTTGSYLATESSGEGGMGGMAMDSGFIGSCKAIKCMGPITVYGGDIYLSTECDSGEGLESKSTITIVGGTLESDTYDDAINAASTITFNGGYVWAHASGNDAIDSNDGTTGIVVNGGVVIGSGAESPEEGFDCDNAAFVVNGGTVIGTGGAQGGGGGMGGEMSGGGVPTSASQAYVSTTVSLTAGTYLSLKNSSGTVICSYKIPTSLNSATVMMSSPSLTSGASATIVYGSSAISNPTTSVWDGVYTTGATLTGGSSTSVTATK